MKQPLFMESGLLIYHGIREKHKMDSKKISIFGYFTLCSSDRADKLRK